MTTQDDYTDEEWKTLMTAPAAAGLLVTTADMSGPIGLVQESAAVTKAVMDAGEQSASDVVKRIAAATKEQKKLAVPELPKDREEARGALIENCRHAAEIVAQKSSAEADAFKAWLMTVARNVAQASKEGGFLGIGGTRVSEGETKALDELAAALGTNDS